MKGGFQCKKSLWHIKNIELYVPKYSMYSSHQIWFNSSILRHSGIDERRKQTKDGYENRWPFTAFWYMRFVKMPFRCVYRPVQSCRRAKYEYI